ncbi:tagatose 6-phosphate kinase [Curtobacterium pusillum]|uniref:Tagatose 6-phosphate kinase n=1 Tax=Curtobacterium pusillum TaxID=69373 RepID=A0AAW3T3H7_9MICO|nr:tagatose 6-phosphate kinase [Curtobacterium pusillum]
MEHARHDADLGGAPMILIVTPNPAVDVTYRVAEQRIGETQRVLDVARRPGGKGLNVGRVLDTAGIATRAVLPLGGPSGRWISSSLDELGIAHTDVAVTGETRTTVTVVDDLVHPTMFGEPGPMVSRGEWDTVTATIDRLLDEGVVDALVVSGSLPLGTDPQVVGSWVASARAHGTPSIVDCSGDALLAAADAGATVCKPNRAELLEATGATDERDGALHLLGRGASVVVVSRGSRGIAAHTLDGVTEVSAIAGVTGNPTGAGDAATAGLVTALLGRPGHRGARPGRGAVATVDALVVDAAALRCAAAYGAAAVLRPVAGEVDVEAVERFLISTSARHDPAGHAAAHHDAARHHDDRTGSPA